MKMPEMQDSGQGTIRKKEFLRLTPGNHIVRILPAEQGFHITYTHWVRRANIECLGDDCPICTNNRRIIAENPKNFRNVKGYSSKRQVFYVNVLDKTPAKFCPSCGEINKSIGGTFPNVCENCNEVIVNTETQPVNKVVILNRGKELYTYLKSINKSILDETTGEPIGIDNYDLMIMVPAKTRRPVVQALPNKNDPVEYDEADIFQLKTAPLQLYADEIKSFLSGVSLSDIFSARNAESDIEEDEMSDDDTFDIDIDDVEEVPFDVDEEDETSEESVEELVSEDDDITESVKNLFKDL